MKILIASDSFKGSLSSKDIGRIGKSALTEAIKACEVDTIPLADGGEGTVETFVENTGGKRVNIEVTGPYGQPIIATYGLLGNGKTAVIEMASASGITLQPKSQLEPLKASSFGTGQLIIDAVKRGCTEIIMGIGGSATNDGGMGMLEAMGFHFKNEYGKILRGSGEHLSEVAFVDRADVSDLVKKVKFLVACDVDNPLVGERGATRVYGPQKGATPEQIEILEQGMTHFASIIEDSVNKSLRNLKGIGAAGGLGLGLLAYFDTKLISGFELISERLKLKERIESGGYDLIITGEGEMDHQTLQGKLPSGIIKLGAENQIPVVAIVGAMATGYESLYEHGLYGVFSIVDRPMPLEQAIKETERLVYNCYYNVGKFMSLNQM
ncbi:glycerate kinase family protein [Fusibacter ferrireducens]|uniref:Glycerate kinase n=1 Tax=Fusibacter ferrireducens TaxID=2785058 RepID=A0ABR9ZPM0_9FIRM|nr:glycerate kinase [Fusibacter ferrireducens]MBF4692073.1 glycerate kinase [Fusibacter ferrireducens]